MTDRTPAVLLAVSGAAFAFLCVMLLHLGGGITEREETRVFMLACILVPISGVVVAAIFDAIRSRFFAESQLYFPLLALANCLLWILLVVRLRHALPPPFTGAAVDLRPEMHKVLAMWIAVNVAVVSFAGLTQKQRWTAWLGAHLGRWVDRLAPFLVFAALLPFTMHTPPIPWKVLGLLLASGFLAFVHRDLDRLPRQRALRIVFDVLVLLGIWLVVFDPTGDGSQLRVLHHNYFLGPIAAVRAGKTLLVDVNCQYGVGVIYFLATLVHFKLMTPSILGLAHVVGFFAFLQYATWYATLRMTTRSAVLSALLLAVTIMVATFEQTGLADAYPSTGGIRFLPGYLFVFCIAAKARFPAQASRILIGEALVVGGTSIWSFEAFVYVFVAYLGSVVYDVSHVKRGALAAALKDRLAPTLMAGIGWHVWLALFTHSRGGQWPHWSYYLDYIRLYGVNQFGALPIEPWTPWVIIGGIYAVGLAVLGYRRLAEEKSDYKPELGVVCAMCSLGVGQYTYFLGRSAANNLFHICLPAFFVAGYAFIRAARDVNSVTATFRRSFVFVGYGALTLCFFSAISETASKLDHTELEFLLTGSKTREPLIPRRVEDLVELLVRYAPNPRRVALFTGADTAVPVYLYAHKASIYPIAYAPEDELLGSAKDRILRFDDHLALGDLLFVDTGPKTQRVKSDKTRAEEPWELASDVDQTERTVFDGIAKRFGFEVVDSRPMTGVFVLRLIPR